jgi:hypothetical protein
MHTPLFYALLFAHVTSFAVGFGSVVVIDTFGLCFLFKLFGVNVKLVTSVANITQRLIWLGFAGLVVSGVPMLYLKGQVDSLTQLKLFFVLMLGLNGVFLHVIKKTMEQLGAVEVFPPHVAFRVGVASAISQLGWWGAFAIGFAHRHISHTIETPYPVGYIVAALLVGIAGVASVGEWYFRRQV